ncbi:MAG: TRAM domain-containing protein [Candidatus Bathyarchaeota archaeon]|nr:MAG: TRAM domain-containing protein [Candidatus Bathyarchaeota archaeon]UCE57562.1 MAG: TRAM domain-containing protein [Candidatus Bathyarchaeota archaeon]
MRYERRRFAQRLPPKPVEIGKEYDVEIQETSRRGEGIARIKGLVTFVPNTKPGDHVRIKITRISQRFAEAEVVSEVEAEEETAEVVSEVEAEEETAEVVEVAKDEEETEEEGEAQ